MGNLLPVCVGLVVISGIVPAAQVTAISPSDLQRMNIAQSYPGLAEELGLSERETAQLLDLIAENQLAQRELSNRIATASRDAVRSRELMQEQVLLLHRLQDAIAALLGPARYKQWQEYELTKTPRMQAASIGRTLARMNLPLSQIQQRSLTAALIASHQRHEQQMRTMPANAVNLKDPDFPARIQEQSQKSLEENTRRLLDDAAPHLNPQQVAALRSEFERSAIRRIPFPLQ